MAHSWPRDTGPTCQISREYSRIDRSDEKWPTRATFRIDISVQRRGSPYSLGHALLAVHVRLVIGEEHVLVVCQQRIDQGPEHLAIAAREGATGNEIDGLAQLGVRLVDRPGSVSVGLRAPSPRPRSARTERNSRGPRRRGSRRWRHPACRSSARRSSRISCCRCRRPPCPPSRSAPTDRRRGRHAARSSH